MKTRRVPIQFRPLLEGLEERAVPATFTVTTVGDSGPGSLRWAITQVDAATTASTIDFKIPGTGSFHIIPLSPLPTIKAPVTIDGTSQTGYTNAPLIAINGVSAGSNANGLVIAGANGCVIKGLIINQFTGYGILLESNGNTVQGCYIGTNGAGAGPAPNGLCGIAIEGSASGNSIGGTTPAQRNLISGNGQCGVLLTGPGATGNTIEGNYIGSNLAGTLSVSNAYDGIILSAGANDNTIGGGAPGTGNFIAGNNRFGINITGTGTAHNLIEGNSISDNLSNGIQVAAGASTNTIGGASSGDGNVISDNFANGIMLTGTGVTGNIVEGNAIGTNGAGSSSLPNHANGIEIAQGASGNTIGGASQAGNLVSGNTQYGVVITGSGTSGNTVLGNFIGIDSAGAAAVPNGMGGIEIAATASGNTIGGTSSGTRNLISGNNGDGIYLTGVGVTKNIVEGNSIGTNAQGTSAVGNKYDGIAVVLGASGNLIGGNTTGSGNLVSGNGRYGVNLQGTITAGNIVEGNLLGLNALSTAPLGNAYGIWVGGSGNTIGGTATGDGNIISGNAKAGIMLYSASNTLIEGNKIGTLANGTGTFGNGTDGILVTAGSSHNTIGGTTSGAANIIANNGAAGVLVGSNPGAGFTTPAGTGNAVLGNSIYGNAHLGIDLGPADGVTNNHPAGLTAGPNDYQNYAVITAAQYQGHTGQLSVTVTLTSVANTTFRVEIFSVASQDASGNGQGQTFLGYLTLKTDATGAATGKASFSISKSGRFIISSTTTNLTTNDTSEFSADITA
jgi:titin